MSEWAPWLRKWKPVLLADSHHEYEFARRVLGRVPGLSPDDVTPQQEFADLEGRPRRMDFAIVRDDIRIAIEVDGWDKTGTGKGMTSAEHQDYTARERALVSAGWTVMRFANREIYGDEHALAVQVGAKLDELARPASQPPTTPAEPQRIVIEVTQPEPTPQSPPAEPTQSTPTTETDPSRIELPPPNLPVDAPNTRTVRIGLAALTIAAAVAVAAFLILRNGDETPRVPVTTTTEPTTTTVPDTTTTVPQTTTTVEQTTSTLVFDRGVPSLSQSDCPGLHPVKGNINASDEHIYHVVGQRNYEETHPEWCFASPADAEAEGFRAAKR